jgi:hypothetical protein
MKEMGAPEERGRTSGDESADVDTGRRGRKRSSMNDQWSFDSIQQTRG